MEQNQEEFDQKRFLIAMVLSGTVLVIWQLFFAPPPPQPPTDIAQQTATQTTTGTSGNTSDTQVAKNDDGTASATGEDGAPIEKIPTDFPVLEHELRNDEFVLKLTSDGARLTYAEVLEPKQYNAEGDLLKEFPRDARHFPFGISFTQNSLPLRKGLVWEFVEQDSVKTGDTFEKVVYQHRDPSGRFTVQKIFELDDESKYGIDLRVMVQNHSQNTLTDNLALDIYGYKDPNKESSMLDFMPDEVEGICSLEEDMEREMFAALDDPLSFDESPTKWGGVNDRYFLFAAIPDKAGKKCTFDIIDDDYLRTRLVQPEFSIPAGASFTTKYDVFVGPKDYDVLEETGPGLQKSVDYGILTFLASPLRAFLVWIYGFVGNWGLAIIILTIIIRLLTWPINKKVYVNSERMKEVQPVLNEIREKYKDDQQRLAEETMKVWKEHGVSPLGCLPMFLQFPILLALYYMILNSVEIYHADFALWYTDLSAPDPYFVLPILMGVVMFAQQSFMTIDTPNKQMAVMMKVMPIMFTAFMLFLPSGVVLYYFLSLLIGLIQQFLIKRQFKQNKAETA